MAKGKRDGLLIAGGGLGGSLAALAMARTRPEVPILVVEEKEYFGGEHRLFFLDRDVDEADKDLVRPLVAQAWPGYYIALPGQGRKLKTGSAAIDPRDIDRAVREALRPDQYRLGTRIVAVRDNELILQGGEKIRADGAIDARGAANLSMLDLGWHKWLGRDYRFAEPHRLDRPVLIDAADGQGPGARFVRCLPLADDRMLIEEGQLSETPGVDENEAALHDLFEQQAASLWRKRDYYRGFNKALFEAAPAARMERVERFYSLDPGVLARFHAGQATMFDRRRIARL